MQNIPWGTDDTYNFGQGQWTFRHGTQPSTSYAESSAYDQQLSYHSPAMPTNDYQYFGDPFSMPGPSQASHVYGRSPGIQYEPSQIVPAYQQSSLLPPHSPSSGSHMQYHGQVAQPFERQPFRTSTGLASGQAFNDFGQEGFRTNGGYLTSDTYDASRQSLAPQREGTAHRFEESESRKIMRALFGDDPEARRKYINSYFKDSPQPLEPYFPLAPSQWEGVERVTAEDFETRRKADFYRHLDWGSGIATGKSGQLLPKYTDAISHAGDVLWTSMTRNTLATDLYLYSRSNGDCIPKALGHSCAGHIKAQKALRSVWNRLTDSKRDYTGIKINASTDVNLAILRDLGRDSLRASGQSTADDDGECCKAAVQQINNADSRGDLCLELYIAQAYGLAGRGGGWAKMPPYENKA